MFNLTQRDKRDFDETYFWHVECVQLKVLFQICSYRETDIVETENETMSIFKLILIMYVQQIKNWERSDWAYFTEYDSTELDRAIFW